MRDQRNRSEDDQPDYHGLEHLEQFIHKLNLGTRVVEICGLEKKKPDDNHESVGNNGV
jgi:hypothetical protein